MKTFFKISTLSFLALSTASFFSCSKDNDNFEGSGDSLFTTTVGFEKAPENLFGDSAYGNNLYDGKISKGFITHIYGDIYAQFPVNYGYNYNSDFNLEWCYTLYNGGFALSKYHDMSGDTYLNQLSVYDESSPSGGNFVVANGSSTASEPLKSVYADYDGCARVYLTDAKGYGVAQPGIDKRVTGVAEEGYFKSVWINNTTYGFLTMKNGNDFATALNKENQGWFKIQFIAFDDDDPDDSPKGFTEAYLANFKEGQADDYIGIIEEWIKVDLSMLPECSILVINFVGSENNEYGLITPAYCALDNFEISVED